VLGLFIFRMWKKTFFPECDNYIHLLIGRLQTGGDAPPKFQSIICEGRLLPELRDCGDGILRVQRGTNVVPARNTSDKTRFTKSKKCAARTALLLRSLALGKLLLHGIRPRHCRTAMIPFAILRGSKCCFPICVHTWCFLTLQSKTNPHRPAAGSRNSKIGVPSNWKVFRSRK